MNPRRSVQRADAYFVASISSSAVMNPDPLRRLVCNLEVELASAAWFPTVYLAGYQAASSKRPNLRRPVVLRPRQGDLWLEDATGESVS